MQPDSLQTAKGPNSRNAGVIKLSIHLKQVQIRLLLEAQSAVPSEGRWEVPSEVLSEELSEVQSEVPSEVPSEVLSGGPSEAQALVQR